VEVTGIAAGLHAVLRLPAGRSEAGLVSGAAAHGLAIEGLASYHTGGASHGPALVIGYGRPAEHAFTAALARLGAVLAEAAGAPTPGPAAVSASASQSVTPNECARAGGAPARGTRAAHPDQ
jgi:GntR family transcriptional regulator/MocR family aminotransferase